jgi:alkanesulfonate monooxygenase SsuD/methylene tetrahydromethanopterin reductase-like flavin-dependent oxidoreductase (luciferase family)
MPLLWRFGRGVQARKAMELGLYTFGDITPDPQTGRAAGVRERYAEIVAAAKFADEAGLDVFGIGEHHRLDVAIASPAVVMAAIAGVTKRLRLTSAVTVLSTLDPVRVYQDFATVDLLSGGRAELIAGRGAYIESFPLFGAAMDDYDALFAEKLDLLLRLDKSERVSWEGRFRPALKDAEISPRPVNRLPIWLGVGGTADSARRAADHGLPIVLANISQPPANFAGQIAEYRQRYEAAGHDPKNRRVAIATHCYVAPDSQAARNEFYPHYRAYFSSHAARPYFSREVPREVFETRAAPQGPIFVGSPQEIIDKLGYERSLFGHDRVLAQIDIGGLPYSKVSRSIELLATQVLPAIRAL